jgi:sugar lactone lactonase YvrE
MGYGNAVRLAFLLICCAVPGLACSAAPRLEEMATCPRLWTGIAVAPDGRVFVSFPRWSAEVPISLGLLQPDGSVRPYPDEEWNGWQAGEDPRSKFVCLQSVHVDGKGRLWVLDPANPLLRGIVPGGSKLLRINLATDEVERIIAFDADIAPPASYLNDVRVDAETETAYLTESGLGALVVVDLATGRARRLLADHSSTKAEPLAIVIDGQTVPAVVHADGIALDRANGWLYYQALTGRTLYRVPTATLRDPDLSAQDLAARVERFAASGVADGLLFADGAVYVSALEEGAIKKVDAQGKVHLVVADERILWPDSFARGPDGRIWFTTSQLHLGSHPPAPYRIFRLEGSAD